MPDGPSSIDRAVAAALEVPDAFWLGRPDTPDFGSGKPERRKPAYATARGYEAKHAHRASAPRGSVARPASEAGRREGR